MAYPLGGHDPRTHPVPSRRPPPARPSSRDSHAMLSHAVEEAARLLQADGAMVYLVEDGRMRFAVDAGIRNPEAQQLIRDLSLPIGVGLFGHAVASGELVVVRRLPPRQALRALAGRRPDRRRSRTCARWRRRP